MNELLDEDVSSNDPVIARLRSALDEVTTESDGLVALEAPSPRVSAGRWMAIAAAVVLVAGAVAAIAINRNNAPEVASTPTELPTTSATEPTLIQMMAPRYTLIAQDLAPGQIETVPNALTNETSVVWALGNPVHGLFMLRSGPGSPDMAPADTSLAGYQMIGDQAVAVSSYGIDLQQQAELLALVQPGSGLPWLLPAEGWSYLGMGTGNDGPAYAQPFSSEAGDVILVVGPLANQFLTLATVGNIESAVVAGREGWMATSADGIYVLWPAGDSGQWASMTVPASLAGRIDGLIVAIVEVPDTEANQPTVETIPVPIDVGATWAVGNALPTFDGATSTDPAIGMPAPMAIGADDEGNEIRIDPDEGPHLVMFQAHWCPHCAANLPKVMEWMADGTIPSWLPVTLVSTAESPTGENHPAAKWLQELGWTGRVLTDSNEGDGAAGSVATAYGAQGWPFFAVIGIDGTVLARATGELTQADMQSLLAGLPNGPPGVVGRLEIPKINMDWLVVDTSLGLIVSAQSGPVFVGGALPTELPLGEDMDAYSMIFGNRTTYGAPFLDLDQLVVGDTFTWTDDTGTAAFEVVSIHTCPAANGCPGVTGALVLSTIDEPFTDRAALFVFARRTA